MASLRYACWVLAGWIFAVGCGGSGSSEDSFEPIDSDAGSGGDGGSGGKGGKGGAAGKGTAGSSSGSGGSAGSGGSGGSAGSAGSEAAGSGGDSGAAGSSQAGSGGSAQAGQGGSAQAGSAGSAQAGSAGSSQAGSAGSAQAGSSQAGSGGSGGAAGSAGAGGSAGQAVQSVFIILMENHSASSIYGNNKAAYFNGTLMAKGAHTNAYKTTIHPSEPNYIWLEAGDNLGVTNDNDPTSNKLTTTDHLVTQLQGAGISWKSYVEDIDGKSCPLSSSGLFGGNYGAKHVPQLFFSDVTEGFQETSANCIAHIRPFSELADDLAADKAPRFSFIVPNLCNDMHGNVTGCGLSTFNEVKAGDDWLKDNVPAILNSKAFASGGLLIVAWDEGDEPALGLGEASDGPIPFVAVGSMVKPGYASSVPYTHSSTLKTFEEIFGVPLLRGAADPATKDLSDLFVQFP